jgi:hypothetical protein
MFCSFLAGFISTFDIPVLYQLKTYFEKVMRYYIAVLRMVAQLFWNHQQQDGWGTKKKNQLTLQVLFTNSFSERN